MPQNKALHQDVASTINHSSVIGVQKDITMPQNTSNNVPVARLSDAFPGCIELRKGKMNEIGEVANEGEIINWLVLNRFGENAKTYVEHPEIRDGASVKECQAAMYKPLAIWAHVANGDFDAWTTTEHYPVKAFKVTGLGQALNLGNQTVLTLENGRWKNGEFCDEIQNAYHHEVNHFMLHNVALYVPTPLQKWIKQVVANLSAGVGNVQSAIQESREEAQERNEIYRSNRVFVDAGQEERIGLAPVVPHLWVPTSDGGKIDMYTVETGTGFDRIRGGTPDNPKPIIWNPSDPVSVMFFESLENARFVSVRKIG